MKKNFQLHDPVKIVNVPNGCELIGKNGKILGKTAEFAECDFYIVWLNKPTHTNQAVVLTEACLELE